MCKNYPNVTPRIAQYVESIDKLGRRLGLFRVKLGKGGYKVSTLVMATCMCD